MNEKKRNQARPGDPVSVEDLAESRSGGKRHARRRTVSRNASNHGSDTSTSGSVATATAQTNEIDPNTWILFFNQFGSKNQGRLVDIETIEPDQVNGRTEVRRMSLQSIAVALGGPGSATSVSILVMDGSRKYTKCLVDNARYVRLSLDDHREHHGLEIEAANGRKTVMTFHRDEG